MAQPVLEATAWAFSNHIRSREDNVNVVLIKEKQRYVHEDGSVEFRDNLRMVNDPQRPIWVTKPSLRNHEFKKELEPTSSLDMYMTPDSQIGTQLCKILDIPEWRMKRCKDDEVIPRGILDNQFIYGADIPSSVFLRQQYKIALEAAGNPEIKFTRGCLDIENEVRDDERINVMTYIHETVVYTAILKEYLVERDRKTDEVTKHYTSEDVLNDIRERCGDDLKRGNFTVSVRICETEEDVIKWIFSKIHLHKTDFIGVWNINHDIPHIIKRLKALGIDPGSVMAHPELPKHLKFVRYDYDKSDLDHFTDRWDWAVIPGYSQFIDAMCLYSRIRKTRGRKSHYGLGAVCTEELEMDKLLHGGITNHYVEQKYHFLRYVSYNIMDCVLMQYLEFKNNDYVQLLALSNTSELSMFHRQMTIVRDSTFVFEFNNRRIIASVGYRVLTPFDALLSKAGGSVLSPNRARNIGCPVIAEDATMETKVVVGANDLDVAAEYPNIASCMNISKETKLATCVQIGTYSTQHVEHYFANIPSPLENSVPLATMYHNLPNYQEAEAMFGQFLTEVCRRGGLSEERTAFSAAELSTILHELFPAQ